MGGYIFIMVLLHWLRSMFLPHLHPLMDDQTACFAQNQVKAKSMDKHKITQTFSDYLTYVKCRNEATKAIKESKHCLEKEIAEGISNNPKHIWKYVISKISKVKSMLSELQQSDGSLINCDSEMTTF